MEQFKKDYPYAKFEKFYVDTDDDKIGVFTSSAGNLGMVSVTDPTFLNSKYSNDLLYGNMGEVLMRKLYESNYDKGMKNHELSIKRAREKFREEYPKADMSRFVFEPRISREGDIIGPATVSYKANRIDSYDNTSDTFLSNENWETPGLKSGPVRERFLSLLT